MLAQIALLMACTLVIVSGVAQRPCHPSWTKHDDQCYQLFKQHLDLDNGPNHYLAGRFCNDIGAYLSEISSQDENEFLKTWLRRKIWRNDTDAVWIGGKKPQDTQEWAWTTSNTPLNFTDWSQQHQDHQYKNCLSMSKQANYSWVPQYCSKTKSMKYICEKHMYQKLTGCLDDSCYYLHLGTYRAKSSPKDVYDVHIDPVYQACPHGHLVQIESREESDFINSLMANADDLVDSVWTGGQEDVIGRWKWSHSEDTISHFSNWAAQPGAPTGGSYSGHVCLGLSRADGWAWNKSRCDTMRPVLCERPAGWFRG